VVCCIQAHDMKPTNLKIKYKIFSYFIYFYDLQMYED
jgi:hypothetical protein